MSAATWPTPEENAGLNAKNWRELIARQVATREDAATRWGAANALRMAAALVERDEWPMTPDGVAYLLETLAADVERNAEWLR